MRILIVDDEQLVRWFLERALKKWGHEVVSAGGIKEALSLIKDKNFDIVFTDLRMPEGNGAYIIDKVSELTNNTKIVVCSAFITSELAEDFRARGMLILKKPFKLSELENVLNLCQG